MVEGRAREVRIGRRCVDPVPVPLMDSLDGCRCVSGAVLNCNPHQPNHLSLTTFGTGKAAAKDSKCGGENPKRAPAK